MKSRAQALRRLREIVEKDLPDLANISIFRDGKDYIVFGRYRISQDGPTFFVQKYSIDIGKFSSLKIALSWCIADRLQKISLSEDIKRLEAQKLSLSADLDVRLGIARRIKDPDIRESIKIKTESKQIKLTAVSNRLDKYVNLTKYWQIKGFNNETARTGRPASNRPNR